MDIKNRTKMNLPRILNPLNQALQLEYSFIVHYPRLASAIQDEEIRRWALTLGRASISHADTVAIAIKKLGGIPLWSFKPFPEDVDIVKIFKVQLGKEKMALQLHRQSAGMVLDISLRDKLNGLARDEEEHIRIVENILSKLAQRSADNAEIPAES